MRLTDLGKLSTRMFKARTSRTLLTILGMGVGIGAILFLVSMGYGMQKVLLETITTSDSLLSLDVSGNQSKGLILSEMEILNIRKVEGVIEVSPAWEVKAQVRFNELTSDSKAIIVGPDFLKLDGTKIAVGESLSDNESNGVVISSAFAKIFNQTPQEIVGKEIDINLFKKSTSDSNNNREKQEAEKIEVKHKLKIIGVVEAEDVITYLNKKMIERVRNFKVDKLWVEHADFIDVIEQYKNDFLYCDPPYYLGNDSTLFKGIYPQRNFPIHHNGFPHEKLRDMLYNHRGGFILSYNNSPVIREWYKDFNIIELPVHYTMGQGETRIGENRKKKNMDHVKKTVELLIVKEI